MSYNGGVSYKGDRELAQEALPECLKFAYITRVMKETAGLDELEKVFDLEGGGTCRVVDLANVRHIYIDVDPIEPEEEEVEEEEDEGETETFIIHAPTINTWQNKPLTDMPPSMVSVQTDDDSVWEAFGTEELNRLFADSYAYTQYYYSNRHAVEWRGTKDLVLYSPTDFLFESRFSMGGDINYDLIWSDQDKLARRTYELFWHGKRIQYLSSKVYVGYAVHEESSKLLIMYTTYSPSNNYLARASITVYAYDFIYPESAGGEYITPASYVYGSGDYIGTITQHFSKYGFNGSGTADKQLYDTTFGSIWFTFNPRGTECVRVRTFRRDTNPPNPAVPGTYETRVFGTYEERIKFTFIPEEDRDPGDPPFVYERIITERADTACNCTHTVTPDNVSSTNSGPVRQSSAILIADSGITHFDTFWNIWDSPIAPLPPMPAVGSAWTSWDDGDPIPSGPGLEFESDVRDMFMFVYGPDIPVPPAWPGEWEWDGDSSLNYRSGTWATYDWEMHSPYTWSAPDYRITGSFTLTHIRTTYDITTTTSHKDQTTTREFADGRRLYAIEYDENGNEIELYVEYTGVKWTYWEYEDIYNEEHAYYGYPIHPSHPYIAPGPEEAIGRVHTREVRDHWDTVGQVDIIIIQPDGAETTIPLHNLDYSYHVDDLNDYQSGVGLEPGWVWDRPASGGPQYNDTPYYDYVYTGTNPYYERAWQIDDTVQPSAHRGGLVGLDLRSNTALTSINRVYGYGSQIFGVSTDPATGYKTVLTTYDDATTTVELDAVRTDTLYAQGQAHAVPNISTAGGFPKYSCHYSHTLDYGYATAIPDVIEQGTGVKIDFLTNNTRLLNIVDSSLAVATTNPEILVFQVDSYDMTPYSEGRYDPNDLKSVIQYARVSSHVAPQGPYSGASAYYYNDGTFTPLEDILGVTVIDGGDDAFGADDETVALCSTIAYAKI